MLEALKSLEIDNTCHFIGTEHPIHRRFQELNRDVFSNFSPDVVSTEFLDPLRIISRVSIRAALFAMASAVGIGRITDGIRHRLIKAIDRSSAV
jgi:hypothetical protein